MKKTLNFFLTLCVVFVAAVSCQDTDEPIVDPTLEVTPPEISVIADGTSKIISIQSNSEWELTASEQWVFLPTSSGSGDKNIDITILANDSEESRTATITVTASTLTKTIEISQEGTVVAAPDASNLSLTTISADNLPDDNTWIFKDLSVATGVRFASEFDSYGEVTSSSSQYGDFGLLFQALESAADQGLQIFIEFPYLTSIPSGAFFDTETLTSPSALVSVIATQATSIGAKAFYGCENLDYLELSAVVTADAMAVASCSKLASIDISDLQVGGYGVISNCPELTQINLPYLTQLGAKGLSSNAKLSQISAPYLENIGSEAFANMGPLENIAFGYYSYSLILEDGTIFDNTDLSGANLYTSYGSYTENMEWLFGDYTFGPFASITGLGEINIPLTLGNIDPENLPTTNLWDITDESATTADFANLFEALIAAGEANREISVLISNMTELPASAFVDPTSAGRVPTALVGFEGYVIKTVGESAFQNCSATESIVVSSAKQIGSYAFQNCSALTNLKSGKVETIGEYAMSGLSLITEFSLSNLLSIEKGAFASNSAVTSYNLPLINSIGDNAFSDNASLTKLSLASVYLGLDILGGDVFESTDLSKVTLTT